MKKLILIGLAITGISGVAYASSYGKDCDGTSRFTENLHLDEARANEVEHILSSYKLIKELGKSGQHQLIPAFIEGKQAQLAAVLTDEEMRMFKENVGEWAQDQDFSMYKKFAGKHSGEKH